MEKLHYLGVSESNLTKLLQYVVEDEKGEWVSLLEFGYSALKVTARDRWIGWDAEQKRERLRYVVNNTRFLVIPWAKERYSCIASRALSLVIKRISEDWARYRGHHILMLETFVSPGHLLQGVQLVVCW